MSNIFFPTTYWSSWLILTMLWFMFVKMGKFHSLLSFWDTQKNGKIKIEAIQDKIAKMDTSKLCRCWLTLECILDLYANCSYGSPLHSAIIDDNYKVVKYLLENHQGIGLDATVKRWLWMKALKEFYDAMLHWRHSSADEIVRESYRKWARN